MDVSAAPLLKGANFFCTFSPSRPNPATLKKNLLRKGYASSSIFLNTPSSRCPFIARSSGGGILKISARLRPPSRRRNTLRKKLPPSTVEQVRRVPETLGNIPELSEDVNLQGEGFATFDCVDTKSEADEGVRAESGNSSDKKSVYWDKLENWVDQYKADSEFWGVGVNPIFMIYQDSDRKIVRVSVDQDEIIRRSIGRAWSIEENDEVEAPVDVNSKIFRAKLIARMIESGEYALPRNSSIVKFFVEGKKSSFLEGLRAISLQGQQFVNMFPRMGFTFLCGLCILLAAMKLFVQNEKVQISREEAEMLKRKIKLRTEREKMEKGSVKVLDGVPELSNYSKPKLDQKELMKDIVRAKESIEKSTTTDFSSHFNAPISDFDEKVGEIREMARKAREQEQKDNSETEIYKRNNKKKAVSKIEARGEASEIDKTSMTSSLVDQHVDIKFNVDSKEEISGNNSPEHLNNTSYQASSNSLLANVNGLHKGGHTKEETTRCSKGAKPMGFHAENIENCETDNSGETFTNGETFGRNESSRFTVAESTSSSSNSSEVSRSDFKIKPRIITSVKEAREFLAQRHAMLSDTVQHDKEVQDEEQAAGVNALNNLNHNKPISSISSDKSEGLAVETSNKFQDSTSLDLCRDNSNTAAMLKRTSIGIFSTMKLNGDESDKITLRVESSVVEGMKNDVLSDTPDQLCAVKNSINGSSNLSESKAGANSNKIFGVVNKIDMQTESDVLEINNLSEKQKDAENKRDECISNNSENKSEFETHATSSSHEVKSLILNPSKNDTVSQSQDLDISSDKSSLWEESQELQDETDNLDISGSTNNYINTDSFVIAESMKLGIAKLDQNKDFTLSGFESSSQSMSEKRDSNEIIANVSGDKETKNYKNNSFSGSTESNNINSHLGSLRGFSDDSGEEGSLSNEKQQNAGKSWIEENFQEMEPLIAKIGIGFKENYMAAKEKNQEQPNLCTDISGLLLAEGDDELEWMLDERLRQIVFKVRDNELAGRDPFHSMDADDKLAFFKGLEKKAEKVNGKLSLLHEWVHSRIENLDYGADGISLNDPLEKIIPRWKGPPIDSNPDFLRHQKPIFPIEEEIMKNSLEVTEYLPNSEGISPDNPVNGVRKMSPDVSSTKPKTVIESSDGTIKPGQKKGKEYWQHTKKWSQGFLEIYNAETDPEIKSIMRDMGKDLDRWITEKETQDVAELMTKIPKRKRRYIAKKLEKIKREVQMFGAPAVVNKYREYIDEKEEDYLWWLDLPYVLCLELYTIEEGVPKVGFYSIEMAADLELNPKQYHVIAFEDPGDSKNFCYVVQAHMDMLKSGKAFVVARPPKDAFRDAKANGFNVTVIRKGQIKLNVDQTLEEVEEELTEIGSKIYHDKIMRERSIDANTLLKGVITADKSTRRSKQMRRKTRKPAKSLRY